MTGVEDDDDDEPVETIEVEKQELIDVLAGFLKHTYPWDAYDAYMRGLEVLLNIDDSAALEALGWLYCFDDGDELVRHIAGDFGIDPSAIEDAMPCAGCGINVHRIREDAYMLRDDVLERGSGRSARQLVRCVPRGTSWATA